VSTPDADRPSAPSPGGQPRRASSPRRKKLATPSSGAVPAEPAGWRPTGRAQARRCWSEAEAHTERQRGYRLAYTYIARARAGATPQREQAESDHESDHGPNSPANQARSGSVPSADRASCQARNDSLGPPTKASEHGTRDRMLGTLSVDRSRLSAPRIAATRPLRPPRARDTVTHFLATHAKKITLSEIGTYG
jgi:hypothetical protein